MENIFRVATLLGVGMLSMVDGGPSLALISNEIIFIKLIFLNISSLRYSLLTSLLKEK